VVFKVTIDLG